MSDSGDCGLFGGGELSRSDEEQIYRKTREMGEQRAFIEQAKGMLMFIYGIDGDAAFDLLRWQSQQHNVKLRLIAEQIVKDLAELAQNNPILDRIAHDRVLLTAHQRISDVAHRQLDGESKTDA